MQDRRRRTALHLPPPSGPVLLERERQSSSTGSQEPEGRSGSGPASGTSGSGGSGSGASGASPDDNPFAPPPEGRPDQPWQPRHPESGDGQGAGQDGGSGRGGWGSQWSSRQPGRSSGGFGSRPGDQNQGPYGQSGSGNGPEGADPGRSGGLRWDPTDPAQRRARYALLSGMWAFFFALFDLPDIALLLGSLAVYWGASSLRAKSKKATENPAASTSATGRQIPPPPATPPGQPGQPGARVQLAKSGPAGPSGEPGRPSNRSQTTAAVSGLVTAGLALAIVAATFTVQLVYRDYYTCVNDALTKTGQLSCNELLPHSLEPVFGVRE
ncbi:hypothetical protein AB0O07_24085 [Streptomyces sp. NPDC093085]|uniref:hypothetical protein n=1 Tax=Streptomyces sp. NPDC093085 TaxID=3155068 RepID=UPI00341DE21C